MSCHFRQSCVVSVLCAGSILWVLHSYIFKEVISRDLPSQKSSEPTKSNNSDGFLSIIPIHLNYSKVFHDPPVIEKKLYSESENIVKESSVTWAEFLDMKLQTPRSTTAKFDPKVFSRLRHCPSATVSALLTKLADTDTKWCQWATSEKGGQVRPGESYGSLKPEDITKFESLSCNLVAKGLNPSCEEVNH